MALFEYFPNYIWNLSVAMALESGGRIGEIVDMCQPLREAASRGEDAGTPQFMAQWVKMADKLFGLADEDEARGRLFSAGDKLKRAALYYSDRRADAGPWPSGPRRDLCQGAATPSHAPPQLAGDDRERVEIPLRRRDRCRALYTRAPGDGPEPDGRLLQRPRQQQGAALLVGPAAGACEARHLHACASTSRAPARRCGCTACRPIHDSERWASPAVDWLRDARRRRPRNASA